jgi:hypothetical protein
MLKKNEEKFSNMISNSAEVNCKRWLVRDTKPTSEKQFTKCTIESMGSNPGTNLRLKVYINDSFWKVFIQYKPDTIRWVRTWRCATEYTNKLHIQLTSKHGFEYLRKLAAHMIPEKCTYADSVYCVLRWYLAETNTRKYQIVIESLSFALYGKRQAKKNFTVSGNKEWMNVLF